MKAIATTAVSVSVDKVLVMGLYSNFLNGPGTELLRTKTLRQGRPRPRT